MSLAKTLFLTTAIALSAGHDVAAQKTPKKAPTVDGIYSNDGAVFQEAHYVVDTTGRTPTLIEAVYFKKHMGGGPKVFGVNTLRGVDANGDGKLQGREVNRVDFTTNYRTENSVLKNKTMTNLISSTRADAGYGKLEATSYMIDRAKVTSLTTVDAYGVTYQGFSDADNNVGTVGEEQLEDTPLAIKDATTRAQAIVDLDKELAAIRSNAALDEVAQVGAEMTARAASRVATEARILELQAADKSIVMDNEVVKKHFVYKP